VEGKTILLYLKVEFPDKYCWNVVLLPDGYDNIEKAHKMSKKAFRPFYMRPKYIIKTILKIRSVEDIKRYITGPSARSYMNIDYFISTNIRVTFKKYGSYPVYKQLHGKFNDDVNILDLLFNTGLKNVINFIRPKDQSIV
jgi:hypothetical protein